MSDNTNLNNQNVHPRVAILLSTRDGEKYLAKQLQSLLDQEQVQVQVFWSDDGSKDQTVSVLQSFQQDLSLHLINLAVEYDAGDHFLKLLYQVPQNFDYYAFCDQDDIWLPQKLHQAIQQLTHHHCDLYGSRTQLIDEQDRYLQQSLYFSQPPSFHNALVQSIAGGNTLVWTRKLHHQIRKYPVAHVPSHDWWLYLFSTFMGFSMYYDRQPFTLYRQHSRNYVGANLGILNQVKRIFFGFQGRYQKWNNIHKQLLDQYIKLGVKENINDYYFFQTSRLAFNPFTRLQKIFESKVYRQTWQGRLSLIAATLLYRT